MTYTDAVQFVTSLSILSVVVEKAVELLKAALPSLDKLDPNKKTLVYSAMTFGFSVPAAMFNPEAIPAALKGFNPVTMYLFIGALTSAGSGVWHTVLKILTSIQAPSSEKKV